MKPGRLALAVGYVLGMIAVAALGAWGIVDAAEEVKEGVDWHVLELSMIGASWLLATLVFGAIFALRGFSLAAPITYLVSCIELAWMASMVALGIGKILLVWKIRDLCWRRPSWRRPLAAAVERADAAVRADIGDAAGLVHLRAVELERIARASHVGAVAR